MDVTKEGLTSDVYFKCLFGARGNEKITKKFIESIIGKTIDSISTDFKLELEKDGVNGKQMVADLIAKDENLKKYIIEMQKKTYDYLPVRFTGYISKTYVADIKVSEEYEKIKQTILIVIMDEDFPFVQKIDDYHTSWSFREKNHPEVELTDNIQIHILELKKYKRLKKQTGCIHPWLEFIINPYGKEVEKMARTIAELKEAVAKLRELEADDEVRYLADAEDFARMDRNSQLKEERQKARAQGLAEGLAEGRAEGKKIEKMNLAKKLLKKGTSIETVINLMDLTEEEKKALGI